jgi:uncharacterized membrane protein required for colicin V production
MNWIDYLLIALIVFSCVAGALRGLLREVIALLTWVAAVWVAWHYAAVFEPRMGGALADEGVRVWAARTIGFLRGLVMIGLFVMLCHALRLNGEPWWRGSTLIPYGERAANVLRGMVGESKILAGHSGTRSDRRI